MKKNKNLLPSIILATGLIIASVIYAYSTRYELTNNKLGIVDKWKGTIEQVKFLD